MFSGDYFVLTGEATFRPVVTLSYGIDQVVGGGEPFAFHLQSVLWHALASVLALLLFARIGVRTGVAAFAAALFAAHPVLTESVDAIAFREDVMATALGIGALLALTGPEESGRRVLRAVLGGGLLLDALLAKESALAFVFLAPLAWWVCGSRPARRRPETVAVLVAAGVFALLRFVVFASPPSYAEFAGGTRWTALGSGLAALPHYLRLVLWPHPLCADYRGVVEPVTSASDGRAWLGAALLAGLVVAAVRSRGSRPIVAFGIAWFLLGLLPAANLVPIPVFMAERFLYLPLVGAAVAATYLLAERLPRRSARVAGAIVCIAFAGLTLQRHAAWKDDLALWRTTHEDQPDAYGALHGYATALQDSGEPEAAIPLHLRALEHTPMPAYERAAILRSLGTAYGMTGAAIESATVLEASLDLEPNAKAQYHLAIAFLQMGRHAEAEAATRRALELAPDFADPHRTLADLARMRGDAAEADRLMRRYTLLGGN